MTAKSPEYPEPSQLTSFSSDEFFKTKKGEGLFFVVVAMAFF